MRGNTASGAYLESAHAAEGPEIAVRDPREDLLDFFHFRSGDVQPVIRAVQRFGLETHGRVVAI